jgi:RNA polymerase sigma-70 factor (ECF subfamily)
MPEVTPAPSATRDQDLIVRVAQGDERAIATLYDRYAQVLYAVAYRIVRERADADEVVLEALAQAWREAPRFESNRGSVAAWLTMMTRSRALDQVRSRNRRTRITDSAAQEDPATAPAMGVWRDRPDDGVEAGERQKRVREALDQLSPPQRETIELAYYEGLSQSEIAERLQEPLGTIKTRMRLGMLKLRDALRPYYYEAGV